MEEENKDYFKQEIHLKEQSDTWQHIQSIKIVISNIKDPVIIGWSVPRTKFKEFFCRNELEVAISNMEKVSNGEYKYRL